MQLLRKHPSIYSRQSRAATVRPTCCFHKVGHSYMDHVDYTSAHNRMFYVYFLGNFQNTPIYCYGETDNPDSVEFTLKRTLPMYKNIVLEPTEGYSGLSQFDRIIRDHLPCLPCYFPVPLNWTQLMAFESPVTRAEFVVCFEDAYGTRVAERT